MRERAPQVEAALAAAIGHPVRVIRREPLSGGDISDVERLHTDAGSFIVKSHEAPPAGFFDAEAAGLAALRASGTTLAVPNVIASSPEPRAESPKPRAFLILEDVGRGQPVRHFDEAFGRGLAELHRHTAQTFGFPCETFCGTTRQHNAWTANWREFYRHSRLGPQLALAMQAHRLSTSEGRRVGRLVDTLDTIIDEPDSGPSLIHGDLWSGNLLVTSSGTPALIDPSVAFAHREAELGMMCLFGNFSERVYAAYNEAFPLEPGWRDRNAIYQLYHLLNHLNLFGGSYRAQVMAVVSRFV